MTKSRIALLVLAPLFFWPPGAAFAQLAPAPLSAEELIAAHNARILDAMGGIDGVAHCPRGGPGDDAIVVCGRDSSFRQRLPLGSQPEPGARHRLIAGELPSASAAPDECLRACYRPVMVPIIPMIRALGRGLDRLLHPD